MSSIEISGLCIQPIALRLEEWVAEGKLGDEELERRLDADARALLEHGLAVTNRVPLALAESLVGLVAEQLGGETGIVDCAHAIAADWMELEAMAPLVEGARTLVDGAGFLVAQASERLLCGTTWRYEGGRSRFVVRLKGLESAGPELKCLLGASLARLVELALAPELDVRFAGVDESELSIFGDRSEGALRDPARESHLYRAALVPPR